MSLVTPADQTYCYHFNQIGSTVAMTDMTPEMVNQYAYTPFGTIANQTEAIAQPFTFVGQKGVMTEPNGFYYMRARYYDPAVRRFISEDPSGFEGGDLNLYAYVGNNPVNRVDPTGLWTLSLGVNVNAALGVGGGGGTAINVGHSENSGWSFSLTGTAQGGAYGGAGAFAGGGITYTNADNVNQLNGTSYQFGRAGLGLGPISGAFEGVMGSGYSGGTFYLGSGIGYTGNSLTVSTTSPMIK